MRNALHNFIASTIAIAALIPSIADAQVRTSTAARARGSGQPWQCTPNDSTRAFNRELRVDSLARQRAAGGVAEEATQSCAAVAHLQDTILVIQAAVPNTYFHHD